MPLRSSFLSSYIDSAVNIVIVLVLVIFLSLPRVATEHYIRLVSSSHSSNSSFFRCGPSPARPPLVPTALALIDSAGYRTVIKPDESTSPFFVIDAAPPSRRHNLPAVKFREDVLVSSYTVARVCPSAAIKRPSYLLRARPRTIPVDPSIGGAIKRWR